jgi:riboflavin kinase/FMN adenylyltransferase
MKSSAVTIGTFDGLHAGHRKLIEKLVNVSEKHGLKSVVVAFSSPVKEVSGVLTTLDEKVKLLKAYEIDEILLLENTPDILNQSAASFFDNFLHKRLNTRHLVVGENFAFGKGREGNIHWLREKGALKGIRVDVVRPVRKFGRVVSSSMIRELLANGDTEKAAGLLGRFYSIDGKCVSGQGLGRKLGFPTLNLSVKPGKLLPVGIFAGLVEAGKELFPSAIFIGRRSTVSNNGLIFPEAHLLDFKGDWKKKDITIHLLSKIRDEKKFRDVNELVENINKDVVAARRYFKFEI